MGGVEIDHRLGVPGSGAEQIFGAEAPIEIADLVIGLGKSGKAGKAIGRSVSYQPQPRETAPASNSASGLYFSTAPP